MKVTWLGHSAFLIEGKDKVLVDPFLSGNPKAARKPEDVDCDVVCVTHGHFDHLGDAVAIARRTGAVIACIAEMAAYVERCEAKAVGFNLGGTACIKDTKVTMVPAFHSSSIGAPGLEFSAAMPVGVVIDSGKVVYHAGDTSVFGDMRLIGEMYRPDLALLPIGGFFTMDPKGAALATSLIAPKTVIPMHYGTWPPIEQDPKVFEKEVKKVSKAKVVILKPGESADV
ncbi:MAG: metal-dependent hydrolase [Thermoplasmata archaeon]|jgi:L-ascorbate metabolism protein UlaG (beta-lactamase superfamily)|nr:metal-dependent hydrolase [Thermoplasmata archaeon]